MAVPQSMLPSYRAATVIPTRQEQETIDETTQRSRQLSKKRITGTVKGYWLDITTRSPYSKQFVTHRAPLTTIVFPLAEIKC